MAFNILNGVAILYTMYNRALAIAYAEKWAYSFNPNYYNFTNIGGDCTNFVSQCLFAGNLPMNYSQYGWFYISLYNRAPAWTGVNEFWDFGTKNTGAGLKLTPCNIQDLLVGDIIQLFNGDRFYHTLLVTSLDDRIKVSAHDNSTFNAPLSNYYYQDFRCAHVFA